VAGPKTSSRSFNTFDCCGAGGGGAGDGVTEARPSLSRMSLAAPIGDAAFGASSREAIGSNPIGPLSAYVIIRQHTSAASSRESIGSNPIGPLLESQHTSAYVSIRQHTSAYVSIRQHASACVSIRQHTSAYVSMRQHTSAYVSIRQHASAYVTERLALRLSARVLLL
jgi:hypothetical protein